MLYQQLTMNKAAEAFFDWLKRTNLLQNNLQHILEAFGGRWKLSAIKLWQHSVFPLHFRPGAEISPFLTTFNNMLTIDTLHIQILKLNS